MATRRAAPLDAGGDHPDLPHDARRFFSSSKRGVTQTVFHALKSFDRAVTRRELEAETGFTKTKVDGALRTLDRAKALSHEVERRRGVRGLYALAADAVCPPRRGRHARA